MLGACLPSSGSFLLVVVWAGAPAKSSEKLVTGTGEFLHNILITLSGVVMHFPGNTKTYGGPPR